MDIATLGIVQNEKNENFLFAEKKKGEIGVGVLSGPGGRLKPGETLRECLIRETREELEVDLDPASLDMVAYIVFHRGRTRFTFLNRILNIFKLGSVPDFGVYVYLARILSGEIHETAEMIPAWYPLSDATFNRTYESDRHWLPQAARGERFYANVYYRNRARDFDHIEFSPFGTVS